MRDVASARWEDVFLAAWGVPDELLIPHVPEGLRIDRVQGRAVLGIVAFDLRRARALGVPWFGGIPICGVCIGVRDAHRRGLRFLAEYVPDTLIARAGAWPLGTARTLVPYAKEGTDHVLRVGGHAHRVGWTRGGGLVHPGRDTPEHAWLERRFLFLPSPTRVVRVERPVWRTWERLEARLDVDWGALLGPAWSFLAGEVPMITMLAEGSEVRISAPRPWVDADERLLHA